MPYIIPKPKEPSFSQKGFSGFTYPLLNKDVQISFVDVTQGHDNYVISKKITHMYYILEGVGSFDIDGTKYPVSPGQLIEIPPKVEYCYTGKMKILLIMNPPWFPENEKITKKNPDIE